MGGKAYVMNVQAETNQDDDRGLADNHDKARSLATVITTFNEHMSSQLKSKDDSMLSPIASRQTSINLVNEPRPQFIER